MGLRGFRVSAHCPTRGRPTLRRSALSLVGICALVGGSATARAETPVAHSAAINPYEALDELGHALDLVEAEYVHPTSQKELIRGALRGLVGELDPHSVYLDPEALKVFREDTSGAFGGIGVEVDFDNGEVLVVSPVEGSPADRAGIQPGDVIVRLNGVLLAEKKPDELVQAMRGPVGSKLAVTIRTKAGLLRELRLVREAIVVKSVRAAALKGGIVYLRIKSFQEGTHDEFQAALVDARRERGREAGLILDLRNNPGGLVREAAAIADEFLHSGLIFDTVHRDRIVMQESATLGGACTSGPIVVLVNEYTASAAELLAGALKDHGRGSLVGARTFGKGSVQTLLPVSSRSAVKLTTALYRTPRGTVLQATGVEPDQVIDPGYVKEGIVVREGDLEGHLAADAETSSGQSVGAPPTTDLLHHGVLRVIPDDPSGGPDRALAAAYKLLVQGELRR